MYTTLIPAIKAALEEVRTAQKVAAVHDHPVPNLAAFPAVIFYPAAFNNRWLTTAENMVGKRFKIFVVVETKVIGVQRAWNGALAQAVDAIEAKIAEKWNGGTVDGHRIWWTLDNGDWYQSGEQDGQVVVAEMDLIVNYALDI